MARVSLGVSRTPLRVCTATRPADRAPPMRPKRTVRKPTRWTPDEWRRVEAAARARRIPPLRFVRESALGAVEGGAAPPTPRRRVRDELVHQLARVLNNLRQLERVAREEGADAMAALIASSAYLTERAIKAAPGRAREAAALLEPLITAGRALNELTHRANTDEALPPNREVLAVLAVMDAAVQRA